MSRGPGFFCPSVNGAYRRDERVEADAVPTTTRSRSKPPTPRGAFWLRFGAAHFLSYPPAFAAALAGVPLAMVVREQAVLSAPTEDAAQRVVLEVSIGAAVIVYVLIHLYALPWSLAAAAAVRGEPGAGERRKRGRNVFLGATLSTAFVVVTGALVGWVWLFT